MRDIGYLMNLIKNASIDAVNSTKPTTIRYGIVKSKTPLSIVIDQKLTLNTAQLVITKATEDVEIGEKVVLISEQGGNKYVMIGVIP